MANFSVRTLKRWYRDSNSIPKKVIAKSRYLTNRIQIRGIRLIWTLITLPLQTLGWVLLPVRPVSALKIFQKLVLRNPWISGALPGLISAALRSGEIVTATSAALKYDRLHQTNHGRVADIWQEFLVGEPGWSLPQQTLAGSKNILLNRELLNQELTRLPRLPNYAESKLAVVAESIATEAAAISVEFDSPLDVDLAILALALSPEPLKVRSIPPANSNSTEATRRRQAKFAELQERGLIEVTK